MAKTTQVREVPTLTEWGQAVDSVSINYAKGTQVEVAKANKSLVPNKGAQPLFHYVNRYGVTGDWYAKEDLTQLAKPVKKLKKADKNGPVTVTKTGFTPAQMAKIQALVTAGVL